MAKAQNKTQQTDADVATFLAGVEPEARRTDCEALSTLMADVTGEPPRMWGAAMVGFGSYHYRYESGREGDSFLAGFAPRKAALTIYLMGTYCEGDGADALFAKLGKFKTGKACLYVKRLSDIDLDVLRELVVLSVKALKRKYG